MNIIWIIVGFMGGVIMAKNSAEMDSPAISAVIAAMIAGCAIAWTAAYHGKRQAVASAVATAVASAKAEATANAAAVLNVYGMSPDRPMVPVQSLWNTDEVSTSDTQGEINHGQAHSQSGSMGDRKRLPLRPLRSR